MMRDVMQSAGLTLYAEIGLVLLFLAFLLVVARSLTRNRAHYQDLAKIPLEDDEAPSRGPRPGEEV